MQAPAFTSCALPPMMPIAFSGQAATQAIESRQRLGSMTGCRDAGSLSPASIACVRRAVLLRSFVRRRATCHAKKIRNGTPYNNKVVALELRVSGMDDKRSLGREVCVSTKEPYIAPDVFSR